MRRKKKVKSSKLFWSVIGTSFVIALIWILFSKEPIVVNDLEWEHIENRTEVSFSVANKASTAKSIHVEVISKRVWQTQLAGGSDILASQNYDFELGPDESRSFEESFTYDQGIDFIDAIVFVNAFENPEK